MRASANGMKLTSAAHTAGACGGPAALRSCMCLSVLMDGVVYRNILPRTRGNGLNLSRPYVYTHSNDGRSFLSLGQNAHKTLWYKRVINA